VGRESVDQEAAVRPLIYWNVERGTFMVDNRVWWTLVVAFAVAGAALTFLLTVLLTRVLH
jgi:hypothetical protein